VHGRCWECAAIALIVALVSMHFMPLPPASAISPFTIVPVSNTLRPQPWLGPHHLPTTGAEPRLFTLDSSELASAPCLQWTPERLVSLGDATTIQAFRQVGRAGDTAEFVLARGREAEFSRSQMVRTVNVTLREFWERTAAAAEGARQDSKSASEHLYHSGPLSGWGLPTLDEDANGLLASLSVWDAPDDISPEQWPASTGPLVWMGGRGVLATPHYDTSLNVVFQCFGTKRWRLWPPQQLPRMKMHPATHPSRRQGRMQINQERQEGGGSAGSGYAHTRAISVELTAGTALYVPPYWTHAVETVTPALSLSILSPSWLEAVTARIRWVKLPFGRLNSAADRPFALRAYLRTLLPTILSMSSLGPAESVQLARKFLSDLYEARHAPVHSAAHDPSAHDPTAVASCATWQAAVVASSSLAARLPTSTELMDVRLRLRV